MRKSSATIYWLVPAEPGRELFRKLIRILAQQLDAPRFEPHLTIVVAKDRLATGRIRRGEQSPRKVLERIEAKPIQLSIRGIAVSSKFTNTLFVRFKPNRFLNKLVVDLARATRLRRRSVRDPHVSLLYKKLPVAAKKELASTIRLPFREMVFDSIKAVRCTLPVRTRADVQAWRVIATKSLRG